MSEAVINQGQEATKGVDLDIISNYERQMNNAGLTVFQERTLPLAKSILSDDSQTYRQTLDALITIAAQNNRHERLPNFWDSEVTEDAFEFQRDFENLRKPCNTKVDPFTFHVNHRRLLQEEITDGQLVPHYMRQGRPFDADEDEETDDYKVYFASGTVDEVSKFLAGYALVSKTSDWEETDYSRINSPQFARTQAIAVANTTKNSMRYEERGHDMLTLYSPEGNGEAVDLYISNQAVPVQVLRIPLTILLPEQIKQLRQEGLALYRSGKFYTDNLYFEIQNEDQAADIYAYSKHQEIAIKQAILKFISASPNNA